MATRAAATELSTFPAPGRSPGRGFLAGSALLFGASAAGTVALCEAMSDMPGMPMPGGWTMSMAWMRMPGQSGLGAGAAFVGMWALMMVAMMLPSLAPTLWRLRQAAVIAGAPGPGRLTALAGAGYFAVWTLLGAAIYPLGVALAALEMRAAALARAVPAAVGLILVAAGAFQRSAWKARHLAGCRGAPGDGTPLGAVAGGAAGAWRHGLRLGLHCVHCCAGPTAVLLALGVMDLGAMALVTAAITAERLAPDGRRVARATGLLAVAAGVAVALRALARSG